MIAGKSGDLALVEEIQAREEKEGLHINNIKDKVVIVATQLLARKVMRKCLADEVLAPVVALAEQCIEGVQFNWVEFLYKDFLTNCEEAQEQGKTFHYELVLLSILLVAGELLEDSQFLSIEQDLLEAEKYASL